MLNIAEKNPKRPRSGHGVPCYKGRGSNNWMDGKAALAKARQNLIYNLNLWLLARHMSPTELARRMGVAPSRVSKWRDIKPKATAFPKPDEIDKICRVLQIPMNYLFLEWNTFFEQDVAAFSPELEAIRQSSIPAAVKAGDFQSAAGQLSLMLSKSTSVTKTLKAMSPTEEPAKKRS